MKRPTKVYVAGPISNGDTIRGHEAQLENIQRGIEAATDLLNHGYIPFCPHLSHYWHEHTPVKYEDWLDYDMQWLAVCDCLLRIPGPSKGADCEMRQMTKWNKPVFKSLEDLYRLMEPEVTSCIVCDIERGVADEN